MKRQPQNYGSINSNEVGFSGDHPSEFNNLCDNIVTNIYTINSSWKTLDSAVKNLGTKKDSHGLRNKIHVTQLSTNQIASVTGKDISKLKLLAAKTNKQQQLQVEKLEGDFKEAVNRYYSVQKTIAAKQKENLLMAAAIQNEDEQASVGSHEQAQLVKEIAFEQDMLLERESAIKQIESDILDVNQIMRDLGALVQEQGGTLDTIENSIDHAVGNIEEGTEQLIKASGYQGRRRKKFLYLILIGIIILIVIIIVAFVHFK